MKFSQVVCASGLLVLSGLVSAENVFENVEQATQSYVYDSLVQVEFEIDSQVHCAVSRASTGSFGTLELAAQDGVTYEHSEAEDIE